MQKSYLDLLKNALAWYKPQLPYFYSCEKLQVCDGLILYSSSSKSKYFKKKYFKNI